MLKAIEKELKNNFLDYILLMVAGFFTVILLILFKGEKPVQFGIFTGYAIFYILWATYHHYMDKSLKVKNMLEYVLIAAFLIVTIKIIISL